MDRLKRQTTEWKEILANNVSNKELVLKMYKDPLKFYSKKF